MTWTTRVPGGGAERTGVAKAEATEKLRERRCPAGSAATFRRMFPLRACWLHLSRDGYHTSAASTCDD